MSQFDFGTIDPQVEDGTMLAEDLNNWRDAVHTTHMGAARPAYIKPGMLWIDSSALPVFVLKLFDGSVDIPVVNFNNSTHKGGVFTGGVVASTTGEPWTGATGLNGVFAQNDGGVGFYARGIGGTQVIGYGSGGTLAAPAPVSAAAPMLAMHAASWTSGGWAYPSNITFFSTETHSNTAQGAKIQFIVTKNGTAAQYQALTIEDDGRVLANAPAGMGYGIGAGGSVTQTTSAGTAVTSNTPSTTITLFPASTPASGVRQFVLNNSTISDADTLSFAFKPVDPGDTGDFWFASARLFAGSAVINMINLSGATKTGGVDIVVNVHKGSIS